MITPSIWWIFQSVLLFINSIAILNEERFLRRIGFGDKSNEERSTIKLQVVNLLRSIRTILRSKFLFDSKYSTSNIFKFIHNPLRLDLWIKYDIFFGLELCHVDF